jgi:hypothetical protein
MIYFCRGFPSALYTRPESHPFTSYGHYLLHLSPLSQLAVLYIRSLDHLLARVIAECITLRVLATATLEVSVFQ